VIGTTERVKQFVGITSNTEDARIELLLTYANAEIKEFVGRDLEQATYTEYYSGDGRPILQLRQRPVTNVTSIHVDNDAYYQQGVDPFPASTQLTPGTDYAIVHDMTLLDGNVASRRGHIERIKGVWPLVSHAHWNPAWIEQWGGGWNGKLAHEPGFPRGGNIRIVYQAGYSAVNMPKDLELAVGLYVSLLRRTAEFGGGQPQSERLGNYQYSLFGPAPVGSAGGEQWASVHKVLKRYREVVI
jgi:gp6-like head-tail connector protein